MSNEIKEQPTIKAFKGFDKNMQCRGYQFEEGKEYEQSGEIKACYNGFHACESPLDVLGYYPPVDNNGNANKFHEVEVGGATHKDGDKIASSKIKIGAEINFFGLAKAHVEYVKERIIAENKENAPQSAATNTGYQSAATNTGNRSAATNTGYQSAAIVEKPNSVASALGIESKAKGGLGSWITIAEWKQDKKYNWSIKTIKSVKVDGEKVKANTFYGLKNGKFVKAE